MPYKPKKPCAYPNCPEITNGLYCDKHSSKDKNSRANASERGYDSRWRKARHRFLKIHPLCVECLKENKLVTAKVVDHIVPHRGDKNFFWDESNWQALCEHHHNKKTRLKDKYQEYRF